MPKQEDAPGYDLLTLTKAQWQHLKRIERDHGIPWFVQIRNLVKADMEGSNKHLVTRLEKLLVRLEKGKFVAESEKEPEFDEEESIKPSEIKLVDPNILADGTHAGDLKGGMMAELRQALGLPPIEEARKAKLRRVQPSLMQILDAPDSPSPNPDSSPE